MAKVRGHWHLIYVLDLRSLVVIKLPEKWRLGAETCRICHLTRSVS